MGYFMDPDGGVCFQCRACGKKAHARSLRGLPKGWVISGILGNVADPESVPDDADTPPEALAHAAASLADYFCSESCGKKYLTTAEIVEKVKRLGVCLVLWGQCILIVDGRPLPKEDQEINRALFGGEEEHPGDAPKDDEKKPKKKHIDEEGDEKPGSPPPLKWDDGRSPM